MNTSGNWLELIWTQKFGLCVLSGELAVSSALICGGGRTHVVFDAQSSSDSATGGKHAGGPILDTQLWENIKYNKNSHFVASTRACHHFYFENCAATIFALMWLQGSLSVIIFTIRCRSFSLHVHQNKQPPVSQRWTATERNKDLTDLMELNLN